MNKYQIENRIIEADSPVKALKIHKLFDSKCKDKHYYSSDIRELCIKNDWYTHGTIAEYDNMFRHADDGSWKAEQIAYDIYEHSKIGTNYDDVLRQIKTLHLYDSVKDARFKWSGMPGPADEIRQIASRYGVRTENLRRYGPYGYFETTFVGSREALKKMALEELCDPYDWNDNFIKDSVKDRQYDVYLNGKLLKEGDELTDFRGDKAWFYGCYHPRKITVLTKKNDPMSTMEYYPSVFKAEIKVDDSTNDSDIDELSDEERKAIEDYKAAIAKTKDVKLLKLFAHILKEETEHLEELQSKNIEE